MTDLKPDQEQSPPAPKFVDDGGEWVLEGRMPPVDSGRGDALEIPEFLRRQAEMIESAGASHAPAHRISNAVLRGAAASLAATALMVAPAPAVLPLRPAVTALEQEFDDGDGNDGVPQPARPTLTPAQQAALDAELEIPAFMNRTSK